MTIAVLIITILTLLFAIAAIVFFSRKAPTAGAVFAILALFFTLADVKAFQFRKMASSPMTMPPTTVSSAPVKEEDWPPVLSSVGSISAVQGAVVSTELGGTVGEIRFQNGGEAKKGDVLIRLDVSAEEAQLHTAQADLELAIWPHAMSFRRRSRMQLNRNSTG
jgi:multidrug efflux pump subunit AcrA (membrane-fusion protein)